MRLPELCATRVDVKPLHPLRTRRTHRTKSISVSNQGPDGLIPGTRTLIGNNPARHTMFDKVSRPALITDNNTHSAGLRFKRNLAKRVGRTWKYHQVARRIEG